jgi:hypothetical protein
MSIAGGIILIVIGAILTFALTIEPIGGVDLHIVGVILMIAGAAGLLLPLMARKRPGPDLPTVRSLQDVIDDGPQTPLEPPGHTPSHNDERPTLDDHRPRPEPDRG